MELYNTTSYWTSFSTKCLLVLRNKVHNRVTKKNLDFLLNVKEIWQASNSCYFNRSTYSWSFVGQIQRGHQCARLSCRPVSSPKHPINGVIIIVNLCYICLVKRTKINKFNVWSQQQHRFVSCKFSNGTNSWRGQKFWHLCVNYKLDRF